jgi:hypothetical protein
LATEGGTAGVAGVVAFLLAFFTLLFFFAVFAGAVVLVAVAAEAAGVGAGAVCAKEIPARASVRESAAIVFI